MCLVVRAKIWETVLETRHIERRAVHLSYLEVNHNGTGTDRGSLGTVIKRCLVSAKMTAHE